MTMLAADYNGWADTPEDEREALDALDLGPPPQAKPRRSLRRAAARRKPPRRPLTGYAWALGNEIWRRFRKAA
jgi:hypothetical protein